MSIFTDPYENTILQYLQNLRESELQANLIEPLLRTKGFANVQDNSGSTDKGVDLIATRTADFGDKHHLYAIQIKKFKICGKAASSKGFAYLLNQLSQALTEPIIDPTTNEKRVPDKCLFFTPFPLRPNVKDTNLNQLRLLEKKGLCIIDGSMLIRELHTHLPSALQSLNHETRYRNNLLQLSNRIRESSVAFNLAKDLSLDQVYVELQLGEAGNTISDLLSLAAPSIDTSQAINYKIELDHLCDCLQKLKSDDTSLKSPSTVMSVEEIVIHLGELYPKQAHIGYVLARLGPVIVALQQEVKNNIRTMEAKLKDPQCTQHEITKLIRDWNVLLKKVKELRTVLLSKLHRMQLTDTSDETNREADPKPSKADPMATLSLASLLKVRCPILVSGPPGGGKTTLLRRLAQLLLQGKKDRLPLLIPLIQVKRPTFAGLMQACMSQLSNLGYIPEGGHLETDDLVVMLHKGRFRLLLDGLDEMGAKAERMLPVINKFSLNFSDCSVILTCRDTYNLDWDRALQLKIRLFTDLQVKQCIGKFFTAEPSSRRELLRWLKNNEQMFEAARTPLMAMLLCALYEAKADMPTTEVELYERRFELLLGKWDKAKQLPNLPMKPKQTYQHILMEVAFLMHKQKVRSIDTSDMFDFIVARYVFTSYKKTILDIIEDLIQRGILEHESSGKLSFGHLTYQEYMAARWLAHHNDIEFIHSVLSDKWWNKTLYFYATIKKDITHLVKYTESNVLKDNDAFKTLWKLTKLADLTSDESIAKCSARRAGRRFLGYEDRW